jgi:diguanylate cyclase (GGDEF)-like protein
MVHPSAEPRSVLRLFAGYALLSLIPVVALAGVLVASLRDEARQRGLAEGRSQAVLVSDSAIEPLLDGHPLDEGLTDGERARLARLVRHGMRESGVLRLRLRDIKGAVVFSDDGSGFGGAADDEAIEAAHGEAVAAITRLNRDSNDHGPEGERAVEAYQALHAPNGTVTGVLELYLPYAPIDRDVTSGLHRLYRDLAAGLAMLWAAGFVISATVSRGLRRQLRVNRRLAERDVLTGLPNRTQFQALAASALAEDGPVAVALLDLDRFKEINDTVGHQNGDQVLVDVAARLASLLPDGDIVGRLGGDEFGIVVRHAGTSEEVLRRLEGLTRHDVELGGLPLSVEASIGVALAPYDGVGIDELLQRADVAMYVAKGRHGGVVRYDRDQDHYATTNLELLADFRAGVGAGQLVLHYQPKSELPDGRVEAVEALVRWNHPTRGLLYPDAFIPLVEPTDLMDDLTDAVLATALVDMQSFDDGISVSVNVSARNLGRADFAGRVVSRLTATGTPSRRLVVEITETALVTDPERAAAQLRVLHDAGVRVSIDDFGQGQTALRYLASLPVDELKIDRSFVGDMLEDPAHDAIVRSIIDLGHSLQLQVVAEGVETSDVAEALAGYGCDVLQGYLVARPMPPDALTTWLASRAEALSR